LLPCLRGPRYLASEARVSIEAPAALLAPEPGAGCALRGAFIGDDFLEDFGSDSGPCGPILLRFGASRLRG